MEKQSIYQFLPIRCLPLVRGGPVRAGMAPQLSAEVVGGPKTQQTEWACRGLARGAAAAAAATRGPRR